MENEGTYIIAEIGVNHNGRVDLAEQMISAAASAGADAVKFQTFCANDMATGDAGKADYQKVSGESEESQIDMLSRLQLSHADYDRLIVAARQNDVEFLSSPFDISSLIFLTETLGVGHIKIASGEITNLPLILEASRRAERLILSTGMSTLEEVGEALSTVAFGRLNKHGVPDSRKSQSVCRSEDGVRILQDSVTILHCTSQYPAPIEQTNLRAMNAMGREFGVAVGYSDHTEGLDVAVAAVARGAKVIEKHFTLSRELPGPDHKASLEPVQFGRMVGRIRLVEMALGSSRKELQPAEVEVRHAARKSLVALRAIEAGEPFSALNIGAKRPAGGVSPTRYWDFLGRLASRDFAPDEPIEE